MACGASIIATRDALCGCITAQSVRLICCLHVELVTLLLTERFSIVFHICSVKDLQALGVTETKLLYTLHWILLFASAECADEVAESKRGQKHDAERYLFSIPTISVRAIDIFKSKTNSRHQRYLLTIGIEHVH